MVPVDTVPHETEESNQLIPETKEVITPQLDEILDLIRNEKAKIYCLNKFTENGEYLTILTVGYVSMPYNTKRPLPIRIGAEEVFIAL